jgi:hypothetical protein
VARRLLPVLFLLSLAFPQSLLLRIRIVEGEGAVHASGSRGSNSLILEVTDELGQPQPGVTVSLQLPDDGPSGLFATGLRSEIAMTDSRGRVHVRNYRVNSLPGPFDIRITAAKDGVRAGTLSRQYIAAGAAPARGAAPAGKSSKKKWIVLAAIAAGAAAGGIAARGKGSAAGPPAPPGSPAPAPPSITIGAPAEISIGAP